MDNNSIKKARAKQAKTIKKCAGTVKYKNENKPCDKQATDNEDYCKKHLTNIKHLEYATINNLKLCSNIGHFKDCENYVAIDNKYKACGKCRTNENEKEKIRVDARNAKNNLIINDEQNKDKFIKCTNCPIQFKYGSIVTKNGEFSKKCNKCHGLAAKKESERDRSDRDYAQYEAQPHVKERRKEYKKNNYDKVATYWLSYRQRQMNKLGLDGYRKKQNDYMKNYFKENPKMREICNMKKNVNTNYKYKYYKREALLKGRDFELTGEQCEKYFLDNCFYCDKKAIKELSLNGIDRKNNEIGYITTNCVTACTLCNMIKGSFENEIKFIYMCNHIMTFLGIVKGNIYNDISENSGSSKYKLCISSAKKRGYEFNLDEYNFNTIKSNPCYLCGKTNTQSHQNGIDRIDNNIGYTLLNSRACCKTCNYMKINYSLYEFLTTLLNIYQNHFKDDKVLMSINDTCNKLINMKYKNIKNNSNINLDNFDNDESSGCVSDDSFGFEKYLDEEEIINALEQEEKYTINVLEQEEGNNSTIKSTNDQMQKIIDNSIINPQKMSITKTKKINMAKNQIHKQNNKSINDSNMIQKYSDENIKQRSKEICDKKNQNKIM